jgi:pilus assembly protein Flp/PilA
MSDVVLYIAAWAETWKASLSDALAENESGQGMVEYGLILALVSVAAIAALVILGPRIAGVFSGVNVGLGNLPATPTAV